MSELMKRLTIKLMDRERSLKVLLSDLKECPPGKIRLELAYLIDKVSGSKAWFVQAYITDMQLPFGYSCPIDSKSSFYDVMSLLIDTGYEISVKTDSPIIKNLEG